MRRSTGLGAAAVLFVASFLLAALAGGTHRIDFGIFQIQSSLYSLALFFFVLGVFLTFLLSSLFPPRITHEKGRVPSSPGQSTSGQPVHAHLLAELGDLTGARRELAVTEDPGDESWYARKLSGDLEFRRGNLVRAEPLYQGSLVRTVDRRERALILLSLARLYESQENLDRAVELYREIVRLAPGAPEPVLRLRSLAIRNRDWDEALRRQEHLEAHVPEVLFGMREADIACGLRYELALREWERGNPKAAQALLKEVFRRTNFFDPACLLSGDILASEGNGQGAVNTWERAFAGTRNPAFLEQIADYYISRNLPDQAIEAYLRNLRVFPDDVFLEYWLGDLLLALENTREATRIFERVDRAVPDWLVGKKRLGEACARNGMHAEAAAIFVEVLGRVFDSPLLPWKCGECGREYEDYRTFCTQCYNWNSIRANGPQAGRSETLHHDEEPPALSVC